MLPRTQEANANIPFPLGKRPRLGYSNGQLIPLRVAELKAFEIWLLIPSTALY